MGRTLARLAVCGALLGLVAACSGGRDPQPGVYKLGSPYKIRGRWYYPEFDPSYDETGVASWYGRAFDGLDTANGEVFDRHAITAAHPTLPLPSLVRVTNLSNGRSLDVRVNDRGPFIGGRLIDLSQAAARRLGFESAGLTPVRVRFLGLADGRGEPPIPTVAARRPPATAAAPVRAATRVAMASAAVTRVPATSRPPAAASPARARCAIGPHFVQVGAFASAAAARDAVGDLRGLPHPVIEPVLASGRALARIRLGPAPTYGDAAALLARVRALGYAEATLVPARSAVETLNC